MHHSKCTELLKVASRPMFATPSSSTPMYLQLPTDDPQNKQVWPKHAYLHLTTGQFGSNSGNSLLMLFSASVADLSPASCSRAAVNFFLVGIGATAAPKAPTVLEPKSDKGSIFAHTRHDSCARVASLSKATVKGSKSKATLTPRRPAIETMTPRRAKQSSSAR